VTNQSQAVASPIAPKSLTVDVFRLDESNGRTTWSVMLRQPGESMFDGYQVYRDAIEGRAQYEAACLRAYLAREPMPCVLDFDTDGAAQAQEEVRQPDPDVASLVAENERLRAITERWEKSVDALRDERDSLRTQLAEAQKDAQRLDRIETALFARSWNGVIDSGSRYDWRIAGDFRHTTARMVGETFREAIDAALTPKEQP
jgi:hypothetical protein